MSEENWQNTVMFRRYSKGIMRSNPGTIRNPRTPEQLVQRAKMSLLVDLARRMAPVINVGFKPLATKQTVHNALYRPMYLCESGRGFQCHSGTGPDVVFGRSFKTSESDGYME